MPWSKRIACMVLDLEREAQRADGSLQCGFVSANLKNRHFPRTGGIDS